MAAMIIKRLLRGILTVVIVIVLIFVLLRVVPGDPATMLAGENATDEMIENIKEQWGLNEPIWKQFFVYVRSLVKLDAGMSYQYAVAGTPVWKVTDLVSNRLGYTIQLASAAILFSILVAIPIGVITALKNGKWFDNAITVVNFIIISFPCSLQVSSFC